MGDEAAGEGGAAMGDDRLAVFGLQPGDFLGEIAARHIGFAPAISAGLRLA